MRRGVGRIGSWQINVRALLYEHTTWPDDYLHLPSPQSLPQQQLKLSPHHSTPPLATTFSTRDTTIIYELLK